MSSYNISYDIAMHLKTFIFVLFIIHQCKATFLPFTYFNTVGINPNIKIRWKDTCPGCPGPGVEITYVQTSSTDVACLVTVSDCVYKGYFQSEPDVPVTVTRGCPNQGADVIEATFKTEKVQGFTFMSQSNGDTVDPLRATTGQFIADHADEGPGHSNLRKSIWRNAYARQLAYPTYGFEMDLAIYYDNNFKTTLHSGSDSAAKAQIEAVMAHVQTYYNLADSLGTTIKLNAKRIEHLSQDWTATEANLKLFEMYVDNTLPASDDNIDGFLVFSYENNMAGTTGIAYLGTSCETPRGGRVSISEWTTSNIVTAQTVAHELAHNLKIDHDFNEASDGSRDPSNPKTCTIESAPNNKCTDVSSIMDYDQVSLCFSQSQLKLQAKQ